MKESLQTTAVIVLVAAAAYGTNAFLFCKRPTTFQNVSVNKNGIPQELAKDVDTNITFSPDSRSLAHVVGNESELGPYELTIFAGHNYSTTFPLTENPISAGGVWIGGATAGSGCTGKPCWGNMQTTPGQAFGVSEPTRYGDPTAITTGGWGPNQTVQGTVVVASAQPTKSCCHELELRLRTTISANSITGYEVYCSMISGNQYCHIASWGGPNGSYVNLDECLGSGRAQYLRNDDVLKATIAGTNPVTITAYINGIQVMQVLDAGTCTFSDGKKYGPWISGNPGIGQYDSRDSDFRSFGWSSFSASDGSSPPSGQPHAASKR
jgi:hypothetical protein